MLSRRSIAVLVLLSVVVCARPVMAETGDQEVANSTAINTTPTAEATADADGSVASNPLITENSAAVNPEPAATEAKTGYPAAFTTPVNASANSSVGSGVINSNPVMVVVVLLFTVFLIVAIAWLMRRIGAIPTMGGQLMKIVSVLSVGTREKVILVEVGGKQVLLGVAPGRISHLQSFDEPVVKSAATKSAYDFSRTIKKLLKQQSADDAVASDNKPNNNEARD